MIRKMRSHSSSKEFLLSHTLTAVSSVPPHRWELAIRCWRWYTYSIFYASFSKNALASPYHSGLRDELWLFVSRFVTHGRGDANRSVTRTKLGAYGLELIRPLHKWLGRSVHPGTQRFMMVGFCRQVWRWDDATLALQPWLVQHAGRLLPAQWVHLEPRVSFCRLRDDPTVSRGLLISAIVGVKFARALFAWGVRNRIARALLHFTWAPNRFWDLLHVQSGDVHLRVKRCCLVISNSINDCSV